MKILIGFLIALFISSQAYAQSVDDILSQGKVVSSQYLDYDRGGVHSVLVVYLKAVYSCEARVSDNLNHTVKCYKMFKEKTYK